MVGSKRLGADKKGLKEAYLFFNGILFSFIVFIFLYISITKHFNTGFTCQYKMITGKVCRTCGLTRALWECTNFNFKKANILNPQSEFVFMSLLFQIIYRGGMYILLKKKTELSFKVKKSFIYIDIIVLLILFTSNILIYG